MLKKKITKKGNSIGHFLAFALSASQKKKLPLFNFLSLFLSSLIEINLNLKNAERSMTSL